MTEQDKEWKFITDPRDLVGLVGKKIQVARMRDRDDRAFVRELIERKRGVP